MHVSLQHEMQIGQLNGLAKGRHLFKQSRKHKGQSLNTLQNVTKIELRHQAAHCPIQVMPIKQPKGGSQTLLQVSLQTYPQLIVMSYSHKFTTQQTLQCLPSLPGWNESKQTPPVTMHSVWPEPLACRWSMASSMLSTSSKVRAAVPYSCLGPGALGRLKYLQDRSPP